MKKKSLILSSVVIFAVAILLNTTIAFNVNGESTLSLEQLNASADNEFVGYEITYKPGRYELIICDEQYIDETCVIIKFVDGGMETYPGKMRASFYY